MTTAMPGMKVRTIKLSRELPTRNVDKKNLVVRKKGVTGMVTEAVPGYKYEVLLVKHDGCDDVGAYWYDELEQIQ